MKIGLRPLFIIIIGIVGVGFIMGNLNPLYILLQSVGLNFSMTLFILGLFNRMMTTKEKMIILLPFEIYEFFSGIITMIGLQSYFIMMFNTVFMSPINQHSTEYYFIINLFYNCYIYIVIVVVLSSMVLWQSVGFILGYKISRKYLKGVSNVIQN